MSSQFRGGDMPDCFGILGAGSIGSAWAIVFAAAGSRVRLFDIDAARTASSVRIVLDRLRELESAGLLQEPAETVHARIEVVATLGALVEGADYVQECALEDVATKHELFRCLDAAAPAHTILASSTSTIPASRFAAGLPGSHRCLVVHPGNPPYLLRVAEVVPAPFTSEEAVARAATLLKDAGMHPVVLGAETEGFVFNRLQGALLREAFCLVRDNVISPEDLDLIVREGLGRRWSVVGPFATAELNTRGGLRRHASLFGAVYARIGAEHADENPWTPETVERVAAAIEAAMPHVDWDDNVRERDLAMIALESMHQRLPNTLATRPVRLPTSVP